LSQETCRASPGVFMARTDGIAGRMAVGLQYCLRLPPWMHTLSGRQAWSTAGLYTLRVVLLLS